MMTTRPSPPSPPAPPVVPPPPPPPPHPYAPLPPRPPAALFEQPRLKGDPLDLHAVLALQIPQTCGVTFRARGPVAMTERYGLVRSGAFTSSVMEDWQLWLQLARAGRHAVVVDTARATIRSRDGSLSKSTALMWNTGMALLTDSRFRHEGCAQCEAAVSAGIDALRGFCMRSDAAVIFGPDVPMSQRLRRAAAAASRDPGTVKGMIRMAAWKARDRLVR